MDSDVTIITVEGYKDVEEDVHPRTELKNLQVKLLAL